MSLTLTQARALVREYLDAAADTDRFPDATVDIHLKGALSAALGRYVASGGDRFTEVVSVSSAATGYVDLSSYDPFEIIAVAHVTGTERRPVGCVRLHERGRPHAAVETVEITLVRLYDIPASASNKLVYPGASPANATSFPAFDHFVAAAAALDLATKDRARRPDLDAMLARYEAGVFMRNPTVTKRSPQGARTRASFQWTYDGANRRGILCRASNPGII